jgi:hypothetical protein
MKINASPLPPWDEHGDPGAGIWSFALDDTTSAAIVIDSKGFYRFELGTITTTIREGIACSKDEAFRKVHIAFAASVLGAGVFREMGGLGL